MTIQQMLLGVGGRISSFSFVTSGSSSASTTVAVPASAQAGDLAVFFDTNETNTTFSQPTGFTLVDSNINLRRSLIAYKVLVSGDLGTNISGSTAGGTNDGKVILIFRPDATINTVTVNDLATIATTAAAGSQTINVNGIAAPVIAIAQYTATIGITAPEYSFSTLTQVLPSAGNEMVTGYQVFNTAASADITISNGTDNGSNILQSFYLTFT